MFLLLVERNGQTHNSQRYVHVAFPLVLFM